MKVSSGQDRHGEITLGPDAKWITAPMESRVQPCVSMINPFVGLKPEIVPILIVFLFGANKISLLEIEGRLTGG